MKKNHQKNLLLINNALNDKEAIFTKLEKPASFPDGSAAWLKYMTSVIQKNANELSADKNSQSSCEVRFIVSKDGRVSDVKAITKQDSKLAEVAVNAIQNGPRWIPGMQNGRVVKSLVTVPVAFVMNDELAIQSGNVRLLSVHQ